MRLPGINIQQPWSQLLLAGKKTVETRTYPLPPQYVGKRLWLVETPGTDRKRMARVIGIIVFKGTIEYRNRQLFKDDFSRHLVPADHPLFGYKPARPKFGWEVLRVIEVKPFEPMIRRGIVYTKPFAAHSSALTERDMERICQ